MDELSKAERQQAQFHKMTETPIAPLVIKLGIPTTISMLVTSIYNLADTFFIGQYGAGPRNVSDQVFNAASTSASGAVGVVFGLMAIIQAFGFMFGQGSGSISSRALGAKECSIRPASSIPSCSSAMTASVRAVPRMSISVASRTTSSRTSSFMARRLLSSCVRCSRPTKSSRSIFRTSPNGCTRSS